MIKHACTAPLQVAITNNLFYILLVNRKMDVECVLNAIQICFTDTPSLSLRSLKQFILYCSGINEYRSITIRLLSFYLSQFADNEETPYFIVSLVETEAMLCDSSSSVVMSILPFFRGKLTSPIVDALLLSLLRCLQHNTQAYRMAKIITSFFKGRFVPISNRTLLLLVCVGLSAMTSPPSVSELCLSLLCQGIETLARCDMLYDDCFSRGIRCVCSALGFEAELEGMEEVGYRFPLSEEEGKVWGLLSLMDRIDAIPVLPSSPEIMLFLYSRKAKVVKAAMQKLESVSLPATQKYTIFL